MAEPQKRSGRRKESIDFSLLGAGEALTRELEQLYAACINCPKCERECGFLQRHGRPADIAAVYASRTCADGRGCMPASHVAFECSLCGLCTAVCPVGADPKALFQAMREEAVGRGEAELSPYKVMRNYERLGASRLLSFLA